MFGARWGTRPRVNLDARPGSRGGFAGVTGEAGRAHVLNARDGVRRQQFETRFQHQFFHEGIAHLHCAALLVGGFLRQILRSKRRSGETIPACGGTDVKDRVPNSFGRAARDLTVAEDAEAKGVHQRIALV